MSWLLTECTCGKCGLTFTPKVMGPTPRWCSGACRQAAYRERRVMHRGLGAQRRGASQLPRSRS